MSDKSNMGEVGSQNHIFTRHPQGNDQANNMEQVLAENDNPAVIQWEESNSHRPLPQRVLEIIEKVLVTEKMVVDKDTCSICREVFVLNETVCKLGCGHEFHVVCVSIWLEHQGTCPICRQRFIEHIQDDDIQIIENIDYIGDAPCIVGVIELHDDDEEENLEELFK